MFEVCAASCVRDTLLISDASTDKLVRSPQQLFIYSIEKIVLQDRSKFKKKKHIYFFLKKKTSLLLMHAQIDCMVGHSTGTPRCIRASGVFKQKLWQGQ